jgi:hypothetical protein
VAYLIVLHALEDRAGAMVVGAQSLQVCAEVRFDLALRLCHEPKTGALSESARERADEKGSQVPKWIEHARARAELFQSLLTPGQMVGLFCGGLLHRSFDRTLMGRESLALVQGLSRDFAGVIDPHQPAGPYLGMLRQGLGWSGLEVCEGLRPSLIWGSQDLDSSVDFSNELVEKVDSSGIHGLIII